MKKCRYCNRELPEYVIRENANICRNCSNKLPSAQRFGEVCDEFKKRIDYPHIKLKMEAEKNDQGTTASV